MPLAPMAKLVKDAQRHHYAVPAFNAYNLESTQAIIAAAEQARSPLILQFSHNVLVKYATPIECASLALSIIRSSQVPIALHYDHGKDLDTFRACLEAGFNSGMLDGSRLPFSQNIQISRRAVKLAHQHKASVELEVGQLAGHEDWVRGKHGEYTDPQEAEVFVAAAKPDALGISFGSSHGHTRKSLHLDLSLLKEIAHRVHVPLVLHGSSGVTDSDLRRAIQLGICKVNEDTRLKMALTQGVRAYLRQNPSTHDPREYLAAGREHMKAEAIARTQVLGSAGKAYALYS